jgi:hypothetical protein
MGDIALDAYVNYYDFIMFDRKIDPSVKSDVLASTLYAQLAAANKVSTHIDCSPWREIYMGAMTTFGWRIRNSDSVSHMPDSSIPFSLWELVTDTFAQTGSIKLPVAVSDYLVLAIPGLASVKKEAPIVSGPVDESGSFSRQQFQVSFMSAENTLHSVLMSFETSTPLDVDPLLEAFDPTLIVGAIDVMFFSAELLDIHYEMYRDAFESALAERKKTLTVRLGEGR